MSSKETADKQTQLIKNRIAKIEEKEKQLKAQIVPKIINKIPKSK